MAKTNTTIDTAQESQVTQAAPRVPDHHVVVRHAFGNYKKGDFITDADEIDAILAGDGSASVHKVVPAK